MGVCGAPSQRHDRRIDRQRPGPADEQVPAGGPGSDRPIGMARRARDLRLQLPARPHHRPGGVSKAAVGIAADGQECGRQRTRQSERQCSRYLAASSSTATAVPGLDIASEATTSCARARWPRTRRNIAGSETIGNDLADGPFPTTKCMPKMSRRRSHSAAGG